MKQHDSENKEKVGKKQIKEKDKFVKLKSNYFLEKVFNNLKRKKALDILKFNKSIKKRVKININDYKEYSEIYSSIEVEIKPVNNKSGEFIKFKFDKKYYHIYFNNNKEETKRNWIHEDENISIIKIKIDYQVESFENLFCMCDCIESIYFKKFHRNNITNMSYMFNGCTSLMKLNLENFITDNVTNMSYMFTGCSSLKELNLDNFNTDNVSNMRYMFMRCSSLKELNLNNFNTKNVTNMESMFIDCKSLNKVNFNNFNTNEEIKMDSMFFWCSSLKELNIKNFINNNKISILDMFAECPKEFIEKLKTQYPNKIEE